MGKIIQLSEVHLLQNRIDEIRSIPTWTKHKHALKSDFLSFVKKKYKTDDYSPHATFKMNNGNRFYSWDYEIKTVGNDQRGYLSKYRGKKLFVVCLYIYQYGRRQLLILPLKN